MTQLRDLVVSLFVVCCVTWSSVGAMQCHQCFHNASAPMNDSYHCDDPFNYVNHSHTPSLAMTECTGSACVKFYTDQDGHWVIRRGCYWRAQPNLCRDKWEDEETGLVGMFCTCSVDLCNSSHRVHSTAGWLFLVLMLTLRSAYNVL